MKVLLTTLNAKYIHTNLALRYLQKMAPSHVFIHAKEFTINENLEDILQQIADQPWDLIGFSCYIWNIEQTLRLCQTLKAVFPATKILLGGPEVSFDSIQLMQQNPFVDFILSGEGEISFRELLLALQDGSLQNVPGLTYRILRDLDEEGSRSNDFSAVEQILQNEKARPLSSLGMLPGIYDPESSKEWENRILYYESSRGCLFRCAYCLSSVEKGVRFFPMERVKQELTYLVQQNVQQIKFVDRTFNANESMTLQMIDFLQSIDNGRINFHFEVMAHLLTDTIMMALRPVRPGLFQFEIGIQSTHEPTLHAVGRGEQFARVSEKVRELKSFRNIHLHLDLIAGLPYESKQRWIQSFDDVFDLEPDALQLGFLKILKGTPLRDQADNLGIQYRPYPPYEVLSTAWISFQELMELKVVEKVVDRFYNGQRHKRSLAYLYRRFYAKRGYRLFEQLAKKIPQGTFSKEMEYQCLWNFAKDIPGVDASLLLELMAADYALAGRFSKFPFGDVSPLLVSKEEMWNLMERQDLRIKLGFSPETSPKEAIKHVGALLLSCDLLTWETQGDRRRGDCFLLIHYQGIKKWNGDYPHIYVTRRDYGILTQCVCTEI